MPNKELYSYDFRENGELVRTNAKEPQRLHTFLQGAPLLDLFGCGFNALFADLTRIATATYFADRASARDSRKHHRERWARRLRVRIPVQVPEVWEEPALASDVSRLLEFLTDDEWELEFYAASSTILYRGQRSLNLRPVGETRTALFSGGLDSFLGAVSSMLSDSESAFVLLSCVTNSRALHNQRAQVRWLNDQLRRSAEIVHLPLRLGFDWQDSGNIDTEPSQRTRGFLFMSLGSIAALNAGSRKLEIFENGIGAINLPYDRSQVSSMSTRAVNPLALLMMERIVSRLIQDKFEIENPFLLSTKGEMCAAVKELDIADAIPLTFSCDGFPVHQAGKAQCGVCTSCLLRRLSLFAGNLSNCDPGDAYSTDLVGNLRSASFGQLNGLRAMDFQVHVIEDLLSENRPWEAIAEKFPILEVIVSELSLRKGVDRVRLTANFTEMFRRYCDEWRKFPPALHSTMGGVGASA